METFGPQNLAKQSWEVVKKRKFLNGRKFLNVRQLNQIQMKPPLGQNVMTIFVAETAMKDSNHHIQ